MKTSNVLILAIILGLAIGFIGINFMHMSSCSSKGRGSSQHAVYVEGMNQRILEAESMNLKNTIVISRLIGILSKQLHLLEQHEIEAIHAYSQDEAIRLALLLSAYPAPPMTEFDLKAHSDDKIKANTAMKDYGKDDFESSSSFKYDDDWAKTSRIDSNNSSSRTVDDYNAADEDDKNDKPSLTDEEKQKQCREWKTTYNVLPGVSWGSLPSSLQREWIRISCDYFLTNSD